jgi:hypothetical protein
MQKDKQHRSANQLNEDDTTAKIFFCSFPLHKLTTSRGEGSQPVGQHLNPNAIHSSRCCIPNQNGANAFCALIFFLLCALIALMQYLAKIIFCQGTKVIPIQKCPMRTQQFASTQIKQT